MVREGSSSNKTYGEKEKLKICDVSNEKLRMRFSQLILDPNKDSSRSIKYLIGSIGNLNP